MCPACGERLASADRLDRVLVILAEHVESAHGRSLVALRRAASLEPLAHGYDDPGASTSWRSWAPS